MTNGLGTPMRRLLSTAGTSPVTAGILLQRGLGGVLLVGLVAVADWQEGPEGSRVIAVASALVLALSALADFGTTPATLRDFAIAAPSRAELVAVARMKAIAGIVLGVPLAAIALVIDRGGLGAGIAVASLALPLLGIWSTVTSKLVADGAGIRIGVAAAAGMAGGMAIAGAVVAADGPAWLLLWAVVGSRAIETAVLLFGLHFERAADGPGRYTWAWLWSALPLAAYWLLSVGYLRMQVLAPAAVLSSAQGGEVGQGFFLYSAGTMLPGAIAVATAPAITRAAARDPRAGLATTLRYAALATAIVVPMAVVLFAAARPLLELLYGDVSGDLVLYLRYTSLVVLLVPASAQMLTLVIALRRSNAVAGAWAFVFVFSTGLLVAASERWGVAGAGAAVLASEVILLALLLGIALVAVAEGDERTATSRWNARRLRGAIAVGALGAVGGAIAPFATRLAAFPNPESGLLLLLALPVVVFVAARALHYDLLSPAVIFALPWTTALGVAQIPLYPSLDWSRETWLLLTLPPLALVLGAVLGAGNAAFRTGGARRFLPVEFALPRGAIVLFALIGAVAWARFYSNIGAVPLLSNRVDAIRFSEFDAITLIGTRFGYVALVFNVFGIAIARRMPDRLLFVAAAGVSAAPFVLSGGRLYFISACAAGLLAGVAVRGLNRRTIVTVGTIGVAFLVFSTSIWFTRIEQQSPNPFKNYLDNYLVQSRPAALEWTIPLQVAASGSIITLNDTVERKLYETYDGRGLYSTKALDRFIPAKDLEVPVRASSPYGQVTTTFVGPWYADFGLGVTCALALALGVAYGVLYRLFRARPGSVALLVFYAYSAFWLVFAIYLNYWTLHGVWLGDVPLLLLLGWLSVGRRQAATSGSPLPQANAAGQRSQSVARS